jgi:ABC-type multidrug transport system, ATPase component
MPVAGLHVERISKSYGRQLAVDGVSFGIAPGEIVGFVGPNGAGKSTTLRILTGLLTPDSGSVFLDGIDQRKNPTDFRARIGVLIEAPAIYPMLRAYDHLAYLARMRRAFAPARIEKTLRDVGLDPSSKKRVGTFSLGMKQRLGIAMAIFAAPSLLVLDEPMNGLDPSGIAELRDFLRGLPERHGAKSLRTAGGWKRPTWLVMRTGARESFCEGSSTIQRRPVGRHFASGVSEDLGVEHPARDARRLARRQLLVCVGPVPWRADQRPPAHRKCARRVSVTVLRHVEDVAVSGCDADVCRILGDGR